MKLKTAESLKWCRFFCVLHLFATTSVFAGEDFALKEETQRIAGTEIAVYTSPKRFQKGAGLFVYSHGMTSRVHFHQSLLKAVFNAGFDVIAYDLPGHGHSERTFGLRGGVNGFEQLLEVLDGVIRLGKSTFEQERVFLSGWSLGGLVTTIYLQRNPQASQAAVLYAPGISLALMGGDFSILTGVKPHHLVHDSDLAQRMEEDDSFFRFPPPCLIRAVLSGELEASPKAYQTKTLLFTAGEDTFVSTKRVEDFYIKSMRIHDFELEHSYFPHSRHDLENDVDSATVLGQTVEFLKRLNANLAGH